MQPKQDTPYPGCPFKTKDSHALVEAWVSIQH